MKRLEKISLGAVVFGVVVVVAFFVIQSRNASRRETALAEFPIPERVASLTKPADAAPKHAETAPAAESPEASFERVTHALLGIQTDEWRAVMREWDRPEERQVGFWERCDREFARAQPVFAAIRERAAEGGPLGTIAFDDAPQAYFNHVTYAYIVVSNLEVDAQLAARHDKVDQAVADIMAVMQLCDALADDPIRHSHHTRWNGYQRAIRALEQIPPGALGQDQIRRIIEHLAQADRRDAFADSFAGEMLLHKPYFDQPELLVQEQDDWAAYIGTNDPMYVLYNTPLGKPLLYSDEAVYLEMLERMADAARQPYHEAFGDIARIQYDLHKMPITRALARGFLFQESGALQRQAEHESRLDVAQLGIALELYQREHGAYPPDLQSAAIYLPEELPVDVFTGESYIYRTNVDPFLLYGVGSDRTDHGGKVARDYMDSGDIVWRGR